MKTPTTTNGKIDTTTPTAREAARRIATLLETRVKLPATKREVMHALEGAPVIIDGHAIPTRPLLEHLPGEVVRDRATFETHVAVQWPRIWPEIRTPPVGAPLDPRAFARAVVRTVENHGAFPAKRDELRKVAGEASVNLAGRTAKVDRVLAALPAGRYETREALEGAVVEHWKAIEPALAPARTTP